ncbi:glutathione S-transferase family protein [Undibacterium danionis]|uniref:Glutathione S-transferase family protein n=1 Tax=Undibacterium danionis TaxID=1812100 RepID=A0ABV6IJY5_9BURK
MKLTLYSGTKNASSWAMRAWLALKEQNLAFEEHVVDIRRPQRFKNLAKIGEFSPPAAVPVLLVDSQVIFDSLAIMEFANEIGSKSLLPPDSPTRARVRSMVAWQHAGLSNLCPHLFFESAFYPDKRALSENEKKQIKFLFTVWEKQLSASNGPYLFGDISLADLSLVPTIIRIFRHQPDFTLFPRVASWGSQLMQRASVQEWLSDADRLEPVWYDDYLLSD